MAREMATHCSVLAWRTEEPGGLESTGSQSQTRLKHLSTDKPSKHEGLGSATKRNFPVTRHWMYRALCKKEMNTNRAQACVLSEGTPGRTRPAWVPFHRPALVSNLSLYGNQGWKQHLLRVPLSSEHDDLRNLCPEGLNGPAEASHHC